MTEEHPEFEPGTLVRLSQGRDWFDGILITSENKNNGFITVQHFWMLLYLERLVEEVYPGRKPSTNDIVLWQGNKIKIPLGVLVKVFEDRE